MSIPFFDHPILNSPYEPPSRHWELDESGQPTQRELRGRRPAKFITPIPKPKKHRAVSQTAMSLDEGAGLSTEGEQFSLTSNIESIRKQVELWRHLPETHWQVTPTTRLLLKHWRTHEFSNARPFFCQVEAIETLIWLTEVAPQNRANAGLMGFIEKSNKEANPELQRVCLKLATGAGKTTVMAMVIAWQTLNFVRSPQTKSFTCGFLVCAPGLTVKDRLRILLPNDPDNYYTNRELVPRDMLEDMQRARIVITNYHAFKQRELLEISAGGRALLKGRTGPDVSQKETEGQMLQRVMPGLMGMRGIMVLNDEAHHCYRHKQGEDDEVDITSEEREEVKLNTEAARLWISGIEAAKRKIGLLRVVDLSATPFFLRGSGYREGTIFPWTISDFSLMDAIECGVVKLPRVPVSENIAGSEMPIYRNLWENIRASMPRKGRSAKKQLDPSALSQTLTTALTALYGHYEKTFAAWRSGGRTVPPCFIIVCQNTAVSKLVYDYVAGYLHTNADGTETPVYGQLELFRNHDEYGNPLSRPNTILVDSSQLDSGEALDPQFRSVAKDEIERFKNEKARRENDAHAAENITDQDLLREVMNTVGKPGQLGEQIRCVVSVSMLTEGWDANTVTHILGIRAFGTQLLCEQVIGRALRRQSYALNDEGLLDVEYSDIFGIPFDFTAQPVVTPPPPPPPPVTQVKAMRPERDSLEIRFPRVVGYRVEPPEDQIEATFTDDSKFELSPRITGPTETRNEGIIGEGADITVEQLGEMRQSAVVFRLTTHLINTHFRDADGAPRLLLFGKLKRVVRQWLEECLTCKGSTYPAQMMHLALATEACTRIFRAINSTYVKERPVFACLDPYNPEGSTAHLRFTTAKRDLWTTRADRCHINLVVLDSDWEAEFCRAVEQHPRVRCYVKNHNLYFEVPYVYSGESRMYRPDFIVRLDDGHGEQDLLNLVVEIKGQKSEEVAAKRGTIKGMWIPGVNNLKEYGRWAFVELDDMHTIKSDFSTEIEERVEKMVSGVVQEG